MNPICEKCGTEKTPVANKPNWFRCTPCHKAIKAEYRAKARITAVEKECTTCKTIKPAAEFSKSGSYKDGLFGVCKLCMAQYQTKRRSELVHATADTKTCSDCKVTKPIIDFGLNSGNLDGRMGYCKKCNSARMVKYAAETEGFARRRKRNREGKKLDASTRHLNPEWFDLVHIEAEDLRRLRTKATGSAWHLDHVVSLDTGGLHCPTNWAIIPDVDNVRKGTRPDQYRRAFGVAIERIA